jgi:signal transduction histidine kinase
MMPDPTDTLQSGSLDALHEIGRHLSLTEDMISASNPVMDLVIKETGADRGYILLLKKQATTYEVMAARNASGGSASGDIAGIGRYLIERALSTGLGQFSEDVATEERFQHLPQSPSQPASIAILPFRAYNQTLGVMCIDSLSSHAFTGENIQFASVVADQIALAVDNRRLRQAVESANRSKNNYLSLVTHELRVPLTSISGYTDMILNGLVGPLTDKQSDFLQTVKRNADRMSVLIGAISDLNRMESGRMKFQFSDFDIAILLDEVQNLLLESIEARGQDLNVHVVPELPPVHADRVLTGRVLTSLIGNASQYTLEGGLIEVKVELDGSLAFIQIIDDGIGISDGDQARLFQPFFRSEDELVRQHVGWGLGLAVAKNLIEAQGGEMGCQSRLGVGSTFTFTLPLTSEELFDAE